MPKRLRARLFNEAMISPGDIALDRVSPNLTTCSVLRICSILSRLHFQSRVVETGNLIRFRHRVALEHPSSDSQISTQSKRADDPSRQKTCHTKTIFCEIRMRIQCVKRNQPIPDPSPPGTAQDVRLPIDKLTNRTARLKLLLHFISEQLHRRKHTYDLLHM
jgi:hypothetical protein